MMVKEFKTFLVSVFLDYNANFPHIGIIWNFTKLNIKKLEWLMYTMKYSLEYTNSDVEYGLNFLETKVKSINLVYRAFTKNSLF